MSILWELMKDPIFMFFAVLMIGVFIVDLNDIFKHPNRCESNLRGALVNLGLLGTFLGIFLGLWQFNSDSTQAIANSVPKLLDGLKLAFATSIMGIGLMTLLNIIEAFKLRSQASIADKMPKKEAYQQKIIKLLEDMSKTQQKSESAQNQQAILECLTTMTDAQQKNIENGQNQQAMLERILQQLQWIDLQADNPATQRLTKLDHKGNSLPIEATEWQAILDNIAQKTWLLGSTLHPKLMPLLEKSQIKEIIEAINTEKLAGYADWHLPQITDFKTLHGLICRAGFEAFLNTQDCWYYVQDESANLYQLDLDRHASGEKGFLLLVR